KKLLYCIEIHYCSILNYVIFYYIFVLYFNILSMGQRYTKADLEEIVYTQLENLDAMHDLLRIMKVQNELLENANKKLSDEISEFKNKQVDYAVSKRKSKV
ncbi:MAG: hypothetical protein AAFX87_22360, partial [Bacteroidota bacterium]